MDTWLPPIHSDSAESFRPILPAGLDEPRRFAGFQYGAEIPVWARVLESAGFSDEFIATDPKPFEKRNTCPGCPKTGILGN